MTADPREDPAFLAARHADREISFLSSYFGTSGPVSEGEVQRHALLNVVNFEQDRADRLQAKLDEVENFLFDVVNDYMSPRQVITRANAALHIVRRSEQ